METHKHDGEMGGYLCVCVCWGGGGGNRKAGGGGGYRQEVGRGKVWGEEEGEGRQKCRGINEEVG